ncbi:MAG: orotidine-5'-phosphate decarboxylase [Anaerolineaceae bacterium]|nr:orotidine-5'-phosphate decarboxylase [Anaerolineaceae bacterium]
MKFIDKLNAAIERNNSLLCVGMDPSEKVLGQGADVYGKLLDWAKELVEQTQDLVCCYKPNIAFFEAFGPKGYKALADIMAWMPKDIPILLDEKRGDIGSTAEAYAQASWVHFAADAVTLSPYLGVDSIKPFLANPEKAIFVLCQTSNPSANEMQGHGNPPLFERVAELSLAWGSADQVGLVIGATQPEALERVRAICPQSWFLAPGVGAQGGDLKAALKKGLRGDGRGMIIPVSRSVMQAADPRAAAQTLRDEINAIRREVVEQALDRAAALETQKALSDPASAAQQDALELPAPAVTGKEDAYKALIHRLYQTGCVKFGQFTLASGKSSPVYLDLRRLVSFPDVLDLAVEAYIDQLVKLPYDTIAGVPYAALPIASIAANKMQKPMVYARKEVKTHGTGQMIEGVFEPGQAAVMVEDVVTSGGSIVSSAETLKAAGLIIRDAVVLVDREQGGPANLSAQGINIHAVLKFSEILEELKRAALIDEATYTLVSDYLSAG